MWLVDLYMLFVLFFGFEIIEVFFQFGTLSFP